MKKEKEYHYTHVVLGKEVTVIMNMMRYAIYFYLLELSFEVQIVYPVKGECPWIT